MIPFALGTAAALAFSWRSLRHPRSHGFPRFFAFESILALLVLNVPHWLDGLGSARQDASWVLLGASLALALHAFFVFLRHGRASAPEPGSPLHGFENTSVLVTGGVYRFLRHPMYASLLYLAWGVALKSVTPATAALGLAATAALVLTARFEEAENLARFGEAYRAYMARTRRFIPFVV
ncbi:MAG: isoprenylcysteine carboxylmethyltransferase family protein [Elusimicrobia bacterium]|nr:isoprenylcysteine carboxylmethyltransferase family protein [Elusimicrobiota bacterium]